MEQQPQCPALGSLHVHRVFYISHLLKRGSHLLSGAVLTSPYSQVLRPCDQTALCHAPVYNATTALKEFVRVIVASSHHTCRVRA